MILRDYQHKCIQDIRANWNKGIRQLIICAPTGSGKTVIFSHLAKKVSENNNRVLILTDRTELLMQASGSIKEMGLNPFYIQSGCRVVNNAFDCFIAMSQTLRRRVGLKYWDDFIKSCNLIIIDECHKQEFNYLFESGLLKDKYVLGFTATPKRSGRMRQLGLDYEDVIQTINVREAIDQGYLVNDDYYGMASPNMDDVEIDYMKGDYKENQMFQKFNSPKLYSGVVNNWLDLTPDTKTLTFCVNIEHCIKTAIEFNEHGVDAKFIVSDISKPTKVNENDAGKLARWEERIRVYDLYQKHKNTLSGNRQTIFSKHKRGDFPVLINAGIATTGYDDRSIETIILNRATTSESLLLQMLGRGSRIYPGKTHFNILDFGGNCERLGYYSEDRIWGLWHESKNGEGLPPVKQCGFNSKGMPIAKGGCRRLILAAYTICPFCGFKYPEKDLKEITLSNIMFDAQNKRAIKTKRIKDMNHREINEYWKAKGHKTAWLWRQLYYKGGIREIKLFGEYAGWSGGAINKAIKFCDML